MMLARALIQAILRPISEADAMQVALAEQKRLDLFDIQCQVCGGLGIVVDLANRWYQCPHEWDEDIEDCPEAEMFYGSKRCPLCDGLGSPRMEAS